MNDYLNVCRPSRQRTPRPSRRYCPGASPSVMLGSHNLRLPRKKQRRRPRPGVLITRLPRARIKRDRQPFVYTKEIEAIIRVELRPRFAECRAQTFHLRCCRRTRSRCSQAIVQDLDPTPWNSWTCIASIVFLQERRTDTMSAIDEDQWLNRFAWGRRR